MIGRLLRIPGLPLLSGMLLKILDLVTPKNDKLVVFSGGHGVRYSDNSRFLFERFLKEYGDRLEVVWVSRNEALIDELRSGESPKPCVHQFSLEGLKMLLKARFVFFSSDLKDLPFTGFSRRTITIQLWHGIPIKSIMYEFRGKGQSPLRLLMMAINNHMLRYRYDYWISSSVIDKNSIALCTRIPSHRVIVAGYPRNDHLIEEMRTRSSKLHERLPCLSKKVILYAPTYRWSGDTRFFPFDDFELERLDSFLEERDAYMLLRKHLEEDVPGQHGRVIAKQLRSERIISVNRDEIEELQELLPYVDILISDYSGAWVDFLLLDRPVIFIPYDIDQYQEENGLLYDYEMITPGPKVNSFQEFLTAIDAYLEDPEMDSDQRTFIKSIFHKYEDGLAYERIFDLMRAHIRH